jgi:predicted TIM-barrel fold metal-dependent hydrolase
MSIQEISHLPTVETPEMCRAVNDQLSKAVGSSGGRFRGFSTRPMGNPEAVPAELERCVKQLGFVGALIPNHARGAYYDGKAH